MSLPAVSPRKAEQANVLTQGVQARASVAFDATVVESEATKKLKKAGQKATMVARLDRRRSSAIWKQKEQATGGVVSSYVQVMSKHADLIDVQEEAMVAICQMIASGHGLRAFIENSGLDAV
eukprot:5711745-Prymnesium_polylepis.1